MNLLPFEALPPHRQRRFAPTNLNCGDWSQIAPLFDQLEARANQCKSGQDFERWLLDWSELRAALDEESTRRYIAMTCHTDNEDAEKAYLHFIEQIEPQLKPREFELQEIFLEHPCRGALSSERYQVFERDTKAQVELFRPENVPLETEDSRLSQQYQKLSGSLTVKFRGEEKTLIQMGRFLEEPERALRQEAWELVAKRRLAEADNFENIFDELVKVRQQIAHNAGFKNYRDYAFRRLGRFDYTPEDCAAFHSAVEAEVMPLLTELQAQRRKQMQLGRLKPWDTAVDPLNRPPLRPFERVDQMVSKTQAIFDRLDGGLAAGFSQMQSLRLLDLENRKGKAPGGYQSTLAEARVPFIFMNSVGLQRDVETILHEAGHAFHALATREEDLLAYRSAPIEFCEVASMSMELLGNEYLEEFYAPNEANRARRTHLEGIASILPWIATVDAFQHWIYTHAGHTRSERKSFWLDLTQRFSGDIDWTGYEAERGYLWHRQLHIFTHPFYYIEYGIAQLGALQVWANSKQNHSETLCQYKNALGLGGSLPLPELFAAAGCKFQFDQQTLRPLVKLLKTELQKLNQTPRPK